MAKVLRKERKGPWGHLILNRPEKINALTLEMISQLQEGFDTFQKEEGLEMISLQGEGRRGFCAGGDIVSVASLKGDPEDPEDLKKSFQFFKREYKLDLSIHQSKLPVIAFAHGVIMGGGLGLVEGARHIILDPHSLLAMPEMAIGLFPDVGANFFLHKLPPPWGLFLALTGARVKAPLAVTLGLADFIVPKEKWSDFQKCQSEGDLLEKLKEHSSFTSLDLKEFKDLDIISSFGTLTDFHHWALDYRQRGGHQWIRESLETYCLGSPLSAQITWDYFHWAKGRSLERIFEMDYALGITMLNHSDFKEGVRALLIDKERNPQWIFPSFKDISSEYYAPYKKLFEL